MTSRAPLRLRWGPHRGRSPEQLVLREPAYVLHVLDTQPGGRLAAIFRDLVEAFDAQPLRLACASCGRPSARILAYPGLVDPIGACAPCLLTAPPAGAAVIDGYEAALRHAAGSLRRDLRTGMRRIIRGVALAKGGPDHATLAASAAFLSVRRRAVHAQNGVGGSG